MKTPNSMLLLLLEADPLCRQARSHLFLEGFMPGQLPAAPGMRAAGKQTTSDRPATAPAMRGGTLVGLPSADTWYLIIQLVTAPLLLRGKTETQERRHKWGTEGMWPYDDRTHRECSGLPLAACNQLVWWCLEKTTASCEKTAGHRGKELGKHRFTLRDEQLFLMFCKNPTSQQKRTNCQYSQATHRPESLLLYNIPSDMQVGQTYAHISTPFT